MYRWRAGKVLYFRSAVGLFFLRFHLGPLAIDGLPL